MSNKKKSKEAQIKKLERSIKKFGDADESRAKRLKELRSK